MIADPYGNRLIAAAHPRDATQRVKYLLEVCDPCQAVWYPVNGVPVSDFYMPRYFDPVAIEGGRYSFTGELKQPLRHRSTGGYLSWIDPEDSGLYQLLAGERGTGACGQPAASSPAARRRCGRSWTRARAHRS